VRSWKSKVIGITIAAGLTASFAVPAQGSSVLQAQSHKTSTSVSSAKSLIRSLYYGYQQAAGKGWSAQKKYIVAHNYPGMYSNPSGCLAKYSSWGNPMPDLGTVAKEHGWKVPADYLNKLANKKPAGDTFVFQIDWDGKKYFNHATVLKGKAYFFLPICDSSKPVPADPRLKANRAYYAAAVALEAEESSLVSRYTSVSGVNYTSDLVMYNAVTALIPDVQVFLDELQNLPATTSELYELNQTWINGWTSYLSCFSTLKYALQAQNGAQVAQANQYLTQGSNYMVQFSAGLRSLDR